MRGGLAGSSLLCHLNAKCFNIDFKSFALREDDRAIVVLHHCEVLEFPFRHDACQLSNSLGIRLSDSMNLPPMSRGG